MLNYGYAINISHRYLERQEGVVSELLVHGLAGDLFGDHSSQHSHHGRAAIIKFNVELASFLFRILNITAKPSNSVVSVILGGWKPCEFKERNEKEARIDSARDAQT